MILNIRDKIKEEGLLKLSKYKVVVKDSALY